MTREEEINLIADCAVPDDKYKEFKDGIIWGAKWADKTMIDKACEWLENELFEKVAEPNPCYYSDVKSKTYDFVENFINSFRKAMEE